VVHPQYGDLQETSAQFQLARVSWKAPPPTITICVCLFDLEARSAALLGGNHWLLLAVTIVGLV
jgi:hypothetical protein